ncbi:MAG: VOC family protein [Deltaproteobacteria bacterium]|nr:VOC family protein [Deltaproteobacteria bacterium]
MIKGINHLGIVVKSIDEVVPFLKEAFGAEEISRVEFPELKQISATVRIGDGCLELMEPIGPDGPVGKFLESKGGGMHHVSLLCDDLVATSERLEAQGFQVIGKMFEGPFKVAFLHPKSSKGILFELAEKSSLDTTPTSP